MLVRNPWVWVRRFRHRCGYGVHSPFAYALVTEVLYSPGQYYAYGWLDKLHPAWVRRLRLRPLATSRLLFRLANYWQPCSIVAPQVTPLEWNYLHEGCHRALIDTGFSQSPADLIYLTHSETDAMSHVHDRTMLVVGNLRENLALWKDIVNDTRTRVTFDLYDMGIALFTPKLPKQNSTINC